MTLSRQAEYIKGKYGKWGVDSVWHDTAIPFTQTLSEFEAWLSSHGLLTPPLEVAGSSLADGSRLAEGPAEDAPLSPQPLLTSSEAADEGCLHPPAGVKGGVEQRLDEPPQGGGELSGTGRVGRLFVTCGNWDIKTKVVEQCRDSGIAVPHYFHEWCNLKDVYLNFYKWKASGMVPMMKGLDIPLQGHHHLGLDDAFNIARVLQRMLVHGAIIRPTARRNAETMQVEFLFRRRVK